MRAALRWTLIVIGAYLLLSMGGAGIVMAPVTLPALYFAARDHSGTAYRIAAAVVVGLTAAQVAWAGAYYVAGESQPWIWLAPLAACMAGLVVMGRATRPVEAM